jgi:hypothetical protein
MAALARALGLVVRDVVLTADERHAAQDPGDVVGQDVPPATEEERRPDDRVRTPDRSQSCSTSRGVTSPTVRPCSTLSSSSAASRVAKRT